jgi:hypothetical protein
LTLRVFLDVLERRANSSLVRPSPDVAETLRKSHGVSRVVGAVVGAVQGDRYITLLIASSHCLVAVRAVGPVRRRSRFLTIGEHSAVLSRVTLALICVARATRRLVQRRVGPPSQYSFNVPFERVVRKSLELLRSTIVGPIAWLLRKQSCLCSRRSWSEARQVRNQHCGRSGGRTALGYFSEQA